LFLLIYRKTGNSFSVCSDIPDNKDKTLLPKHDNLDIFLRKAWAEPYLVMARQRVAADGRQLLDKKGIPRLPAEAARKPGLTSASPSNIRIPTNNSLQSLLLQFYHVYINDCAKEKGAITI